MRPASIARPPSVATRRLFPLVVGDVIHNLCTALDFMWYDAVERIFGKAHGFTKFPFRQTRDEVAAAIKGRKIPQHSEPDVRRVHCGCRPSSAREGSTNALWSLHELDIVEQTRGRGLQNLHVQMGSQGDPRTDESGKELTFPVRAVVANNIASKFQVMGDKTSRSHTMVR